MVLLGVRGVVLGSAFVALVPVSAFLEGFGAAGAGHQDTRARVAVSGSGQDAAAFDELANELSQYVLDAATNTGPNGITALFLASVLRKEIAMTPLLPMMSPAAARDREIARSQKAVSKAEAGETVDPGTIDASIGIG